MADILQTTFSNGVSSIEMIFINIWLKLVTKGPIDNKPAL